MLLTFRESEETIVENILSALSERIQVVFTKPVVSEILSFPGLEIRQNQHRVLQDGEDINLTRLEYRTLVLLATNPGIVLTRSQIFESVWNMDSDSCQSSISTMICNLRKKIEPDSKNPAYIKTVLGAGYKFDITNAGE